MQVANHLRFTHSFLELAALRPPFLGNNFNELKQAISVGRSPPIPPVYSESLRRVIASLLRTNPTDRPTAAAMLKSPELAGKLQLEGERLEDASKENDVMKTIVVPQNLRKLSVVLPKPCYPDLRPHSPSSWIVADQKEHVGRAAEDVINAKPEPPPSLPAHPAVFRPKAEDDRPPVRPPMRPRQPLAALPSKPKSLRTYRRPSEAPQNYDGKLVRNRVIW